MVRLIATLLIASILLTLNGCMFAVVRGARYAYGEYAKQDRAVNAALLRFQQLVRSRERDQLAGMFAANAEWTRAGSPPVVGADSIVDLLVPAPDGTVSNYRLSATSTRLLADGAIHSGTYQETRVAASGKTTDRRGAFSLRWSRQADGGWLIARWRDGSNLDELSPATPDRG